MSLVEHFIDMFGKGRISRIFPRSVAPFPNSEVLYADMYRLIRHKIRFIEKASTDYIRIW